MNIAIGNQKEALNGLQTVFSEIMADKERRHELLNKVSSRGVAESTLYRWVHGTKPSLPYIRVVLEHCTPEDRARIAPLAARVFSTEISAFSPHVDIPPAFYQRTLVSLTKTPPEERFENICYLVLRQALTQIDPGCLGLDLILSQCLPPTNEGTVRGLQERRSISSQNNPSTIETRWALVGAESAPGEAILSFKGEWRTTSSDRRNIVSFPLLRGRRIGGCLTASSVFLFLFSQEMQKLLQDYADLLSLALDESAFYSQDAFNLCVMPQPEIQKKLIDTLPQRILGLMREEKLDHKEADRIAFNSIVEELSDYSPC